MILRADNPHEAGSDEYWEFEQAETERCLEAGWKVLQWYEAGEEILGMSDRYWMCEAKRYALPARLNRWCERFTEYILEGTCQRQ